VRCYKHFQNSDIEVKFIFVELHLPRETEFTGSCFKGIYIACSDNAYHNETSSVQKYSTFDAQNDTWTTASSNIIPPNTYTSSDHQNSNITNTYLTSQAISRSIIQRSVKTKYLRRLREHHHFGIEEIEKGNKDSNIPNARKMKEACTCPKECSEKVVDAARYVIFKTFWALPSHTHQWDFITKCVSKGDRKRIRVKNSKRTCTLQYNLPIEGSGGIIKLVTVCKKMFLNTLSIGGKWVRTALDKIERGSGIMEGDRRGKRFDYNR
jgi:hypothetical protein